MSFTWTYISIVFLSVQRVLTLISNILPFYLVICIYHAVLLLSYAIKNYKLYPADMSGPAQKWYNYTIKLYYHGGHKYADRHMIDMYYYDSATLSPLTMYTNLESVYLEVSTSHEFILKRVDLSAFEQDLEDRGIKYSRERVYTN